MRLSDGTGGSLPDHGACGTRVRIQRDRGPAVRLYLLPISLSRSGKRCLGMDPPMVILEVQEIIAPMVDVRGRPVARLGGQVHRARNRIRGCHQRVRPRSLSTIYDPHSSPLFTNLCRQSRYLPYHFAQRPQTGNLPTWACLPVIYGWYKPTLTSSSAQSRNIHILDVS